jgi:protease-4
VRKLAGTKPVVVSMGATAASGGYYVAAAADHILANPGTLTGSIGVRLEFANLQELADKLGISYEIFESGQFKTAGSPFRELSAEERAYLQALVDDLHRQFVSDVSKGRGMSIGEVERWADGRALTGSQALDAGLVDELGGLEEAFSRVKSLAGVSGKLPLWEGPPEERNWIRELLSASMNELAESFVAALAEKSAPRFAAR